MKKRSIKRVLSMIASVAMLAALIPASVMADTMPAVNYVESDGKVSTCSDYEVVDASNPVWDNGWYVVNSNDAKRVVFNERIEVTGDVYLILNDTTVLYALKGIHVGPNSSLSVFGQSIDLRDPDTGIVESLEAATAPNGADYAAIGGNAGEKNGALHFFSGRISVYSYSSGAAGIGTGNFASRSAYKADTSSAGEIEIRKVYIAAQGGNNAAGIGGGDYADAPTVSVRGGTVRSIGNTSDQQTKADDSLIGAAGIGAGRGGCMTQFGMVYGNVIAASNGIGPGIGDGYGNDRALFSQPSIRIIKGGTLLALSTWGTSAMMGARGQDMSLFNESVVSVYDSAKIRYLDKAGWPKNEDEADTCVTLDVSAYKDHNIIFIEPCAHEDHSYDTTSCTHTEKCATCRTVFGTEEKHVFDINNKCSVCGYEAPVVFSVKPKLEGRITLVYGFRISDTLKNDPNAYASFTSSGKTRKVKFTDTDVQYLSQDNSYAITVPVDAVNLADSIVMNVYNGNNQKQTLVSVNCNDYTNTGFSYSVMEYAEHIQQNYRELATALYNYGAMVCNYFKGSYGDWQPDMTELDKVGLNTLEKYALEKTGRRPSCISRVTISISFDSDNTLRITYYLEKDEDISKLSFLLDNKQYTPKKLAEGVYAVDVENIAAPDLEVEHTFGVRDADNQFIIKASALSYALTSYNSGKEKRQNLAKAFYLYYAAAEDYFTD